MQKSVGMAIRITQDNIEKIAVVNGGLVPEPEELPLMSFFYFPYDFNAHTEILLADEFWRRFDFANTPNDGYFVDVNAF
jgi:hypothetical protein